MNLKRSIVALVAVLVLVVVPARASGHSMSTSAVVLDVGSSQVTGEVQLPVDRLAAALGRDDITTATAATSLRAELERYVRSHISAVGEDGRAWRVTIGNGHVERADSVDYLVMSLTLTPPDGAVTDFALRYDVMIHQLVTHKAIATVDGKTLGVFNWHTKSLTVDGNERQGFTAAVGLGVAHISEGADHLLFLLMLLIPAPLVAQGRRWRRRDDTRASVFRVLHVVTAFAVGHSITLALASFGLVHLPSRLVESLIALSILVSAVHALRPLVPRGEVLIAVGFGLVHGLAFATLLGGLGVHGASLVTSLLGFNLGIELTQLLVVALMMPSLFLISRTRAYDVLRPALAAFGIALSGAWLLERTQLIGTDPFASLSAALIDHPFVVAAAFAVLAAVLYPTNRLRTLPT